MKKRFGVRTGATALAALLAAATLAACDSADGTSAAPARGGGFSVATIEPNSLIPGKATNAQLPLAALFTPLVGIDGEGELEFLQAESVEGSPDATTWTITLRDGWTFHDGEPVTASSYVDAWNHNAYGPNAFPGGAALSKIVGWADLNPGEGKPKTKEMSGLRVLDELSFEVRLAQPDSQFPFQLTANNWAFHPLPSAAYDDMDAYETNPVGNGPFQMSGPWRHDQSIPMTAYEDYAGSPEPVAETLEFKIYSSTTTAYTDALAGNVDFASVPADKLGAFRADFGDRFVSRGQGIEFLGFPLFDEQWADADLRRAISLAIDREAINDALFGGAHTPADSFLPPTTPGGSPASCDFCDFDPERARTLLADAGGFEGQMVIQYPGGYGLDQEYEAIANQIRQNLELDVVAQASPTVAAYFTDVAERKYTSGPLYSSWSAPFPSAQAILGPNFTEGNADYAGTYYTDPEVTDLLASGDAAATAEDAIASYHAAEALLQDAFAAAPLFFLASPMVYSERVSDVAVDALSNLEYAEITTVR